MNRDKLITTSTVVNMFSTNNMQKLVQYNSRPETVRSEMKFFSHIYPYLPNTHYHCCLLRKLRRDHHWRFSHESWDTWCHVRWHTLNISNGRGIIGRHLEPTYKQSHRQAITVHCFGWNRYGDSKPAAMVSAASSSIHQEARRSRW